MTIRISSRALWFSALRGLGWGFLRFEALFLICRAVTSVEGTPVDYLVVFVVAVPLMAAALVFPIQIIIVTALQAIPGPSVGWRRAVVAYGVAMPVVMMVPITWSDFWGTAPGYVYLWTVTIVSMAASGFALLSVRGARPGEDEAEVVLPLWRIPLAVVAGLALGGVVYAALYDGRVVPSLGDASVPLLMIPQLFLASTIGCYAVALVWRLSGQRESEGEVSS